MSQQNNPDNKKITVLGAGSWGTTLAWLLARDGRRVALWSHTPEKIAALKTNRQIEKPVPVTIPDSVLLTADIAEAVEGADMVLFCVKAQAIRSVAMLAKPALRQSVPAGGSTKASPAPPVLVSAAKGIELKTFLRMTEVIEQSIPGFPVCALSGPNLAAEILAGLPTASVVACKDSAVASAAQQMLNVPTFRVYSNSDMVGVELGGALKNVIAVAAGGVDGLSLGTNAKAALMTRGLAEMTRLATKLGARPTTLSGLSGMGDLVATCYSSLSRNYSLGYNMAKGMSPHDAEAALGATAEAVTTAEAVCDLSKKLDIELPIADQVLAALKGTTTPVGAIMALMKRPLASEER